MPRRIQPIDVSIPADGVGVFESIHDPAFRMASRADPFDKLFLVGRGVIDIREAEASHIRANEGDAVYIPRNLQHHMVDVKASTLFLICFTDALGVGFPEWTRIREELGTRVRVWQSLPFESALLPVWRRLLSEQERGDSGSRALVKAESVALLVRLVRARFESASTQGDRFGELLAELTQTSFEPWTVDEAARWVGVSRRHFTKTIKATTGKTFVELLTTMRIGRMKELLTSGGYTVAGAAYACGFGDLAHFYRTFKRYEGQTPLQWLDRNAG